MNKLLTRIVKGLLGLSMAVGVGVALGGAKKADSVHAADELFYTLTPTTGTNNGYAGNCDINIGPALGDKSTTTMTWNLTGNSTMIPWRIGGKNLTNTARSLYSKTAMPADISKVAMEIGAASSVTIVSSTSTVASDANFSNVTDTVSLGTSIVNKTTTITPSSGSTWASGSYYKFTFNVTIGGSNKFIEFKGAKFYSPVDESLTSISVSGSMTKTEYTTADEGFDPTGLTVTGNYSGTQKPISSGITWSYFDGSDNPITKPADLGVGSGKTVKVVATASSIDSAKYVASSNISVVEQAFANSSGLAESRYVISYDSYYFTGSISGGIGQTSSNKPTNNEAKFTFTLVGNDRWTIKNDNDDYLAIGDSSKSLSLTSSETILVVEAGDSSDTYKIRVSGGRYMAFYTSNSDFRTYNAGQADAGFDLTLENADGEVTVYTINYLANGGDGSMDASVGSAPTVKDNGFTAPDGKVFSGWNTAADGSGDVYTVGQTVLDDITLYAQWSIAVGTDVVMAASTGSQDAKVNGLDAIKCGTGSAGGTMTITLKVAGISKIKAYIAGWKGENGKTLTVSISSGSISPNEITTVSDNGITASSPFTLAGTPSDFAYEFEITGNVPADTVITLSTANKNERYVVWGATDRFAESFASDFLSGLTCDASGETAPTYVGDNSWEVFEGLFNALDGDEKARLSAKTSSVELISAATERYDYIVGKYGYKDFMGRNPDPIAGSRYTIDQNVNSTSSTIIVVVVALTSITSIGVLLVIKRKRALTK